MLVATLPFGVTIGLGTFFAAKRISTLGTRGRRDRVSSAETQPLSAMVEKAPSGAS